MSSSRKIKFLMGMFAMLLGLGVGSQAWAIPGGKSCDWYKGISCYDQNDCLSAGCPECFICADTFGNPVDGTNTKGNCIENDQICQDLAGSECVIGECNGDTEWKHEFSRHRWGVPDNLGCEFSNPPMLGVVYEKFPPICLTCMQCGNGICEADSENCDSCPEDCQEPDKTCILDQATLDAQCNQVGNYKHCNDGDIGTEEYCKQLNVAGDQVCIVQTRTCNPEEHDFVCPMDADDPIFSETNCVGPSVGVHYNGSFDFVNDDPWTRRCHKDDPFCDPDCWNSPQECGNGMVEGTETCDVSVPGGSSGNPPILDTECRPSGTQGECSACGDGIVQTQVEECDVGNSATGRPADDSACPGECNSLCLCNVEPIPGPQGPTGQEGPTGPAGPEGPIGPVGLVEETNGGGGCSIQKAPILGSIAGYALVSLMVGGLILTRRVYGKK